MFKFNSRNTGRRCYMFKVKNNDSRAMAPFSSGVHNRVYSKYLPVQGQQNRN